MKKWEYQLVPFSLMTTENDLDDAERSLDAEGESGWEVVSFVTGVGKNDSYAVALLKRPKQGAATPN